MSCADLTIVVCCCLDPKTCDSEFEDHHVHSTADEGLHLLQASLVTLVTVLLLVGMRLGEVHTVSLLRAECRMGMQEAGEEDGRRTANQLCSAAEQQPTMHWRACLLHG